MKEIPPGDDVCPVPPPLEQEPPEDRFCDLVLTGGVASGVVYPWAVVELARAYRFRNIGGTSVGAMAAALAAAAEYGRRTSAPAPFEPLRRTPAALGQVLGDGRTRMMSLFQANPRGRRLVQLWCRAFNGNADDKAAQPDEPQCAAQGASRPPRPWRKVWLVTAYAAKLYLREILLGALAGVVLGVLLGIWIDATNGRLGGHGFILGVALIVLGALLGWLGAIWTDIRLGLVQNNFGLCKGGTLEGPDADGERPALTEWLHNGIQASAGLDADDRPLTFRDLWSAPARPGMPGLPVGDGAPAKLRSINLQVITTNATHGRPYRLPLENDPSRLFFDPDEWKDYFPPVVMRHLKQVSRPYAPADPRKHTDPPAGPSTAGLLQVPGADLPVVVAARLSLSFPLLFAGVPLWAIDYEAEPGARQLQRCLFTDGGVSSNFPIHLFDAALPRWPTFGLWLDQRQPGTPAHWRRSNPYVWLPRFLGQGWGDNWDRFDRGPETRRRAAGAQTGRAGKAAPTAAVQPSALGQLSRFLMAVVTSAKDWSDRATFRLPHVRTRVARLMLLPNEGGLHIGMPRDQILRMAHNYGTTAGRMLVKRFAGSDGQTTAAWREQRWTRLVVLVKSLRARFDGLAEAADWSAHTQPMTEAITAARQQAPVRERRPRGQRGVLTPTQAESMQKVLRELEHLEREFQAAEDPAFDFRPEAELRLRAPL